MRLIDADALMQSLGITNVDCDKCAWYDKEWSCCKRDSDFECACFAIENAPTIEERKMGKWIKHGTGVTHYECSHCGVWFLADHLTRNSFCPNCGCDMRGEEE
jgi:hypothetical protein